MHLLITGASRGIGLAIARKFASTESKTLCLSICARKAEHIAQASEQLEQETPGLDVFAASCDVSDHASVSAFVQSATDRFGPADILINNAGFGIFQSVDQMTLNEFDSVIAANLRGVFLMTKEIVPSMIERNNGTIVTISSLAGRNGFAGGAAYCASKFGVRGLMQSLFLEVRKHNIRVLTIFPGSVDTAFFDNVKSSGSVKPLNALEPEDIADIVYHAVQLPVRASVSELDIRPTNPKFSA